jgi:membrane complex biogenesis BtpA family protein
MPSLFKKIFDQTKPIIGMVHLLPTNHHSSVNLDSILKKALQDTKSLILGGVDSIMIENNYDMPHTEFAHPKTIAIMTLVCNEIRKLTNLPIGVCTLWNDYKTSLSIAKVCKLQFVRIPVFVNSVETSYGKIFACPEKVLDYRISLQADNIAILSDIYVKHSTIISPLSLIDSAKMSKIYGSDAVIITGKWTADSPLLDDLKAIKNLNLIPVLVGSGVTLENKQIMLQNSDGLIVGTYFKDGENNQNEVNIKSYEARINAKKVKNFMRL